MKIGTKFCRGLLPSSARSGNGPYIVIRSFSYLVVSVDRSCAFITNVHPLEKASVKA